jgi:hypothetical protein
VKQHSGLYPRVRVDAAGGEDARPQPFRFPAAGLVPGDLPDGPSAPTSAKRSACRHDRHLPPLSLPADAETRTPGKINPGGSIACGGAAGRGTEAAPLRDPTRQATCHAASTIPAELPRRHPST